MTRNLKALGLSLVAMLAFGAMAAASASADDVLTSNNNPETITGVGTDNVFTIPGAGSVECATANFHGIVAEGASEGTFKPEYIGDPEEEPPHDVHCISDFGEVTVDTEECGYILTGDTENGDAPVWIECEEAGEAIRVVTGLGVTLSIPPQTPTSGGVVYTNNTPESGEVTIDATVGGITYSCSPHFLCTLGSVATHGNNATYNGTVVAHGANGPIGFSEP